MRLRHKLSLRLNICLIYWLVRFLLFCPVTIQIFKLKRRKKRSKNSWLLASLNLCLTIWNNTRTNSSKLGLVWLKIKKEIQLNRSCITYSRIKCRFSRRSSKICWNHRSRSLKSKRNQSSLQHKIRYRCLSSIQTNR